MDIETVHFFWTEEEQQCENAVPLVVQFDVVGVRDASWIYVGGKS